MKRGYLTAVMVFCVCASAVCLADPPSTATVKPIEKTVEKPIVVPFEMLKSGHMAVSVKVNGKGPYRVIFDTGAPLNLFNNKLAKEAGLLKGAPKSLLPFVGTVAEVKVKELQVGTEKTANQPAIVMDHPLVELMSKRLGPLYGIVGFPFFARYKMVLDYEKQTLTLTPNGYKPGNPMKSLEATMLQLAAGGTQAPKVLSPAAQWGFRAGKQTSDEEAGVAIKEVLAGSAAAAAGLKKGDRLLSIDGRWTDSLHDVFDIVAHLKPGIAVPFAIRRDGKTLTLEIKPRAGL